jgi:hypothetical protein
VTLEIEVKIPVGESLSEAIDVSAFGGYKYFAIKFPSAWTGEASGTTFQGAGEDMSFADIYSDSGVEVTSSVIKGKFVSLSGIALDLAPYAFLKVRAGTGTSPQVQALERTFSFIAKK